MEAKQTFNENLTEFLKKIELRHKTINYIKTDLTISNSFDNGNYWELWMLNYFKRFYKPNTNFIDLGGHIGSTSLLMSEILSNGNKIYTFEPVFHDILLKNIKDNLLDNKIVLYPCGLGNHVASITFPKINLSDYKNFGGTTFINNETNNNETLIDIPIYKLDSFNLDNVSVIKIDVENMEIEVLEGAIELITKCKPAILIEAFDLDKLKNSDIFNKLSSMGYIINAIPEGWNDYLMIINPITNIPKNIYICDKELKYIENYSKNWKRLNPDYNIVLYDDELIKEFFLKEYTQTHCDIFNFIEDGPIKADFWRICVLYKYGGVYVDADAEPLIPICFFLEDNVDLLTCSSYGPNFNPNFIMAYAGDETLKECIETYLIMYSDRVPYSYWGWSIMTLFNNILKLDNYNKESGIYFSGNKKVQILKEIQEKEFYDDHNIYKGLRVFNNRYSNYDCFMHSFKC